MSNSTLNSTNVSCEGLFDSKQLQILGITQAVASLLSICSCAFILFIMLIFKKYLYRTQRLLIYLTVSVMLVCTSFVIRGFGYSLINNTVFCAAVAFAGQYSGGCILGSVTCIIINIFVLAVLKKENWNLEPLYVLGILSSLPPLTGSLSSQTRTDRHENGAGLETSTLTHVTYLYTDWYYSMCCGLYPPSVYV